MKKNRSYLIMTLLFLLVLSLSIGYSAFGSKMHISGIALEYRIVKDVRITNLSVEEVTNDAVIDFNEYNYDNLSLGFYLPKKDSTVKFKVEVTNIGNERVGIYDIVGLPSNLKMRIDKYSLKDPICNNERCTNGANMEFYITISYKNGSVSEGEDKNHFSTVLKFDFRKYFNVSYVDVDNSHYYPSEVMENADLDFYFDSKSIIPSILRIKKGSVELSSSEYTFNGGRLRIPNVDGDIEIINISNNLYEYLLYHNDGSDDKIDFSDSALKNAFLKASETKDSKNPIYYFRGDSSLDNNVLFGGYCWKIVRTTDSKGVKLIYNGDPVQGVNKNNEITYVCPGVNTSIDTVSFQEKDNVDSIASAGYMWGTMYGIHRNDTVIKTKTKYGNKIIYDDADNLKNYTIKTTENSQGSWSQDEYMINTHHYSCLSTGNKCKDNKVAFIFYYNKNQNRFHYLELKNGNTLEDAFKSMQNNKNNSSAKIVMDNWYNLNLKSFSDYIEDTVYCNDREITDYAGFDPNSEITKRYVTFAGYNRFNNKTPSLKCGSNDSFTMDSKKGNGALTYPIGLLTSDEALYAGALNKSSYLNDSEGFLLMTPYRFDSIAKIYMFNITKDGTINSLDGDEENNIRPVISLKNGIKFTTGNGSADDPFVIETKAEKVRNISEVCSSYSSMSSCASDKGLDNIVNLSWYVGGMRRYQGTNQQVTNNYICFGTDDKDKCIKNPDKYMYRIIGIESSGRIKVVKYTALDKTYQWGSSKTENIDYVNSLVYKALTDSDFLKNTTYIPEGWLDKISDNNWLYGDMFGNLTEGGANNLGPVVYGIEIGKNRATWYEKANKGDKGAKSTVATSGDIKGQTVYYLEKSEPWKKSVNSKAGLLNISDYYLSMSNETNCQKDSNSYQGCINGWLYLGNNDSTAESQKEWLMTRTGWSYNWGRYNSYIIDENGAVTGQSLDNKNVIRPVFYLSEKINIGGGSGTKKDPYIIKDKSYNNSKERNLTTYCEGNSLSYCLDPKGYVENEINYLNYISNKDDFRFQGTKDQVKNNYICYGTTDMKECINNADKYMYRIINYDRRDATLSIIKNTPLKETYSWSNNNQNVTWINSNIYKALENFINDQEYIPSSTFDWLKPLIEKNLVYGSVSKDSVNRTDFIEATDGKPYDDKYETKSKVSLMNIRDYFMSVSNGAYCEVDQTNNECLNSWLRLDDNLKEWLILKEGGNSIYVVKNGTVTTADASEQNAVRPLLYLNGEYITMALGEGTISKPYVIRYLGD